MTVGRSGSWGRDVERDPAAVEVRSDADVASAVAAGRQVILAGGDLHRTLGAGPSGRDRPLREVTIDLLVADLDDGTRATAAAHLVARRPSARGGWWRGELLIVMNAEFLGERDVAPRGHPNDGVAETLHCSARMSLRQRLLAARRARTGSHLPHPDIRTGRLRQAKSWTFDQPLDVFADGVAMGATRELVVRVEPDAASVCI